MKEVIMILLDTNGLIPAIIQDHTNKKVLMLGYMNAESIAKTYEDGVEWFYSRSRNRLWQKGEESGNYLTFISMQADCDGDTLLVNAEPYGPTCHTGEISCFFQPLDGNIVFEEPKTDTRVLDRLYDVIISRKHEGGPLNSYTRDLFESGISRIGQKVIEESGELTLAAVDATSSDAEVTSEAADLLYHVLVLLTARDVELSSVMRELQVRSR